MSTLLAHAGQAAFNPAKLARKAIKHPGLLDEIIAGIDSETPRIKYGCAKTLRLVSEVHPELAYPYFDFFVSLLDHRNKILQWEGALVLAELARVDRKNKFAAIFDKYFSPVPGPVLITAANVIRGSVRIALAKPELADRVAAEVLKVAEARYQTSECRNVAIGHAILAFGEFIALLENQGPVLRFVKAQINNPRPATRKKAEQFLKRLKPVTNATTARAQARSG